MFLRCGIKSVSMDDIAKKLCISKKTIYLHLDNKQELISLIMKDRLEEERAAIEGFREDAHNAIEEIMSIADFVVGTLRNMPTNVIYDLQKYYPELWKQFDREYKQHIYDTLLSNLKWGMKQGVYRKDLDPDIITKFYVGKTMVVVDDELFPLGTYDCDVVFEEHIKYHLHGIASVKGLKLIEEIKSKRA